MLKPTKAQTQYWETQLKRYGLAESQIENRAEDEARKHLEFGLDPSKTDYDGRSVYNVDADAIGERLDAGDWPISLC
jgi:hypothetical protein